MAKMKTEEMVLMDLIAKTDKFEQLQKKKARREMCKALARGIRPGKERVRAVKGKKRG